MAEVNLPQTASSVFRASPGTWVVAFVGLTAVLLAVAGAKWAAGKASTTIRTTASNLKGLTTPQQAAAAAPAADNAGF